ncbi:MAG: DMT family transporter [Pseudomonadota bacterium]
MQSSHLIRLAGIVFIAMSFIVLGDTAGKLLMGAGVDPIFVAWTRFAIAAIVMAPLCGVRREELVIFTDWRVILRGLLISVGISCILTALRTEPIANVFGAFFIGPIVSFILAIVILGERATPARAAFLLLGFLGVLLVVKPGFGFSPGLGWALAAGMCYGAFLATTRVVAPHYRPRLLLLSHLVIGGLALLPFGMVTDWPAPDVSTIALILGSSAGSTIGNYLVVVANRQADAALVAPLIYTQLISATAMGYVVFGDWPDIWSLTGLVVILTSGLGTLWLVRSRA